MDRFLKNAQKGNSYTVPKNDGLHLRAMASNLIAMMAIECQKARVVQLPHSAEVSYEIFRAAVWAFPGKAACWHVGLKSCLRPNCVSLGWKATLGQGATSRICMTMTWAENLSKPADRLTDRANEPVNGNTPPASGFQAETGQQSSGKTARGGKKTACGQSCCLFFDLEDFLGLTVLVVKPSLGGFRASSMLPISYVWAHAKCRHNNPDSAWQHLDIDTRVSVGSNLKSRPALSSLVQ